MSIDFSRVITAEDKAAAVRGQRSDTIKAQCRARIQSVLDPLTVANLQGATLTRQLSKADRAMFRAGHDWTADTIRACREAIASGREPAWPEVPEGLAELSERF